MPSRRKFPILGDMPPARRALATSALYAASTLCEISRKKRGGRGDVLVSFANLGDQLRMMNVLSRFDLSQPLDVLCNAGTEQAFPLYPTVGTVRGYANQGAGVLIPAARVAFSTRARYERGLIPQPFVTQPLALAAAKNFAAETMYSSASGDDDSGGRCRLATDDWKRAYEHFFEHAFSTAPVHARPQIRAELRHGTGTAQRRIVLHCTTSASSRAIAPAVWKQVFQDLQRFDLELVVLGSASEEAALRELGAGQQITFFLGRPLLDVARLLSTSRLFVGVDSSMMNLADAVGIPSVVLYLYTSPAVHGPFYTSSVPVVPERGYTPVGVEPMISWNALVRSGEITPAQIVSAIRTALAAQVK